MMDVLEVSENGTLTLPAEMLGDAAPRTQFRVERREGGLLVNPLDAQPEISPEEWLEEWDKFTDAVTKAWKSDKSAVEIVSEMRR